MKRKKTVNPYVVMCKLCELRGKDYAKVHGVEVTELLNEGCPNIEEALKIVDNADRIGEIRERMQAIYDHLDDINDILQAAETMHAINLFERNGLQLQVVRRGKTPNPIDSEDFIDPADFV